MDSASYLQQCYLLKKPHAYINAGVITNINYIPVWSVLPAYMKHGSILKVVFYCSTGSDPEKDFVTCPVNAGGVIFFNNNTPHRRYALSLALSLSLSLSLLPGAVARSEESSLGMQAAPSSIPTSGTFFLGDLVMKTFLRPFSLFRWFKKSRCQLLAEECALSTGKLPRRLAQEQCG